MKKLILLVAASASLFFNGHSQTYLHDFQKEIGLPYNSISNYTFCENGMGGYAIAATIEDVAGGNNQNELVVYELDNSYNIMSSLICEVDLDAYGGAFRPMDIQPTRDGYIIAGALVVEGTMDNGGFLLHVTRYSRNLVYDWIQIYPNNSLGGSMPVLSLHRVVETSSGYMTIGRSPNAGVTRGVAIGTDAAGNVNWAMHLYDDEYGTNDLASLADMVKISDDEVAIVGTVNSFVIDDADVFVVKLREDGSVVNERVYEIRQ